MPEDVSQSAAQSSSIDDDQDAQGDADSGVSVVRVPLVTDELGLYGAGVFQSTQILANPSFGPGIAPTSPGVMALREFAGGVIPLFSRPVQCFGIDGCVFSNGMRRSLSLSNPAAICDHHPSKRAKRG